ncbi:MAG TPA: LL-diaminopimelate aminotransferase [bacterium]|nr:LL-diaminopimelate aminotransferase [bacterium]HPN43694.1 LL-diaminopimelate aminotransferase [bacterium]
MATINANYNKLAAGYLFPEIARRARAYQEKNPGVELLRLGIGNTTEPLTPAIIQGLHSGVDKLASVATYTGYGDEQGDTRLREALCNYYKQLGVHLQVDDIFISDGAKPDSGNIQSIFGLDNIVAVQDPAYPVYVDTNVIAGRTGQFNPEKGLYDGIVYMPCTDANGFFSPPPNQKVDIIYLCSPNNPTGAVASREQLQQFVDYANKHKAVIIFDAAYSFFIKDPNLPKSIFEIDGAQECALEISSFSKIAGFTGVRLGWAVVPKTLVIENTNPGKVNSLWNRRQTTFFNGASNIVQEGGLAVFTSAGMNECRGLIDYYMHNASIIKEGMQKIGLTAYGGDNAPYIWMKTPHNIKSWEFFDKLLHEAHVVCTPGSGFGPSGEGYVRLSSFGHRENIIKAVRSIQDNLKI